MPDQPPVVEPAVRDRIQAALDQPESRAALRDPELLGMIDLAHEQAQRALSGDPTVQLDHPELSWAKTHFAHPDTRLDYDDFEWAKGYFRKPHTPIDWTRHRGVTDSGALVGVQKYEMFDPGWLETLAEYLAHAIRKMPDLASPPAPIAIPDKTSLAIAGDWGTGYWEDDATAAKRVAGLMTTADYTIHIGDTYYAGTEHQIEKHLTEKWPTPALPPGNGNRLAIPGNHEMYTKGKAYLGFVRERCPLQQGASYFALSNAHWLVLALDTAHYAKKMYLHGTLGPLGNPQLEFLEQQLAARGNRRVMLFTHHPPYDLTGPGSPRPLQDEVLQRFTPDYWAWGHLHNSAVYHDAGAPFRGRLIGHGAIPYGVACELEGKVKFYENVLVADSKLIPPDAKYPNRVLNGFLRLDLDGAEFTEALIAEDGQQRWPGKV